MSKILVIDDSRSIIDILDNYLTFEGYEVLTAENGNRGIDLIKKHKPDLVVTDIIMPEKDGVEVAMYLKLYYPEIKVVAMSAGGAIFAEDHLSNIRKLGADYVLVKPFTKKEILSAVSAALRTAFV